MKRNRTVYNGSIIAMAVMLFFVCQSEAQEAFEVKWTMDYTQAGVSSHANFTPADAQLLGGPNTYGLPTKYTTGGAIVAAYVIRPWPFTFSSARCMEFTFTAKSFKYDISSISFRLRRSGNGPDQVKVRTSVDSFAGDLNAFTIGNINLFNAYSIPVSYKNLSNNTFTIRIYAFNSTDIYGTLWFDEIKINGQVLAIVLPLELTQLKAMPLDGRRVALTWETAWEKDSKEFVIQRSSDLKQFTVAGSVPASGETTGSTRYGFTDTAPCPGTSYYRLRSVDRDGAFTESPYVSVTMPETHRRLQVFPNPAPGGRLCIDTGDDTAGTFTLTNLAGHAVAFRLSRKDAGQAELWPVHPLASGFYLLTYLKNGRKEQVKVLVL